MAKSFIQDWIEAEARDTCYVGYNFTSITMLSCFTINSLINNPLTIAERCALQVYLAVTVSEYASPWEVLSCSAAHHCLAYARAVPFDLHGEVAELPPLPQVPR